MYRSWIIEGRFERTEKVKVNTYCFLTYVYSMQTDYIFTLKFLMPAKRTQMILA